MATATTEARVLPRAIRRGLKQVRRRVRRVTFAHGLGTLLLVLAAVAVAGMAADLLAVLPQFVRWAIWAGWIAAGLAVLAGFLLWPLGRRLGWTDLAAVAERARPELEERLTGSVALLEAREHAHGSRDLIAALAEDTEARVRGLDLAGAVSPKRARDRLTTGLLGLDPVAPARLDLARSRRGLAQTLRGALDRRGADHPLSHSRARRRPRGGARR